MILLQRDNRGVFHLVESFAIPEEGFLIGRGRDCHLVIHDGRVARRHCRILQTGQGLVIEDLGGTNGTLVNYQRLHRQPLSFGDRIDPAHHCLYLLQEPPAEIEALRQRAEAIDTPAEELSALAGYYDSELLQSLAKNPNTPPKILGNLAGLYPEVVWKNPLIPLLLLSDPMLSDLAPGALCELLSVKELEPALLVHFALHTSESIRLAVAMHPKTTRDVLQLMLYQSSDGFVPQLMPLIRKHPSAQEDWIASLCQSAPTAIKVALAMGYSQMPEYVYQVLARDVEPTVRLAVLRGPHSPNALRVELVRGADAALDALIFRHRALANHKEMQQAFLDSHDEEGRVRLIESGMLDDSFADQFFADESVLVRLSAVGFIKRLKVPLSAMLLRLFSKDKDPAVRRAVQED